ncbi:MAG: winged helix-turn-helix transcriptional regulator, partial [Clostridiales bacterium]|nr:winged helix-turn-helix transcriptional regulator [Clostridiales bacterium]
VLPLLAAFEKLEGYIDARNAEHEMDIGLFRMSVPDYHKRAVREAMVNAFSHRDYTRLGRVRVCISDEGLTIANPGGFIEGVTLNNLLTAEPQGRNPLLSDALKRVGLAEKTGRGIDRIYEGSLLYGKLLPDYAASTSTTVSLFIPRCAADVQFTSLIANEQNRSGRPLALNTLLVLNELRSSPRRSVKQLSQAINLSDMLVSTVLENAVESGIVEAYGSGRGRTYMISRQMYGDKGSAVGYVRHRDIDEIRYAELVLLLASSQDYISRSDVMELLHINGSSAYRVIKKLSDEGKLTAVNKGRYAKYRLAE